MFLVKGAGGISRQVAFEGKQAKEQPAIQLRTQRVGKSPPFGEFRTALLQPVNAVSADEPVSVLIRAATDAGTMEVFGIHIIDIPE
jgi:hypothetical protein